MRISDWSSDVCSSDLIGAMPTFNNIQALNTEDDAQGLQSHLEDIETLLDEGLGMKEGIGTEFDLDNLLRMDGATQMDVLEKSKGKLTVNEQRAKLDKKPVEGGDTVYLQEQDHSRSEEHTSELQSLMRISYAVFCLKKKKQQHTKQ